MSQELVATPHSYDELLDRLDHIKKEYRRVDQRYRLALYQMFADAMSIATAIEADRERKDQFLKSVGQKSDVVYAAMIFITDAKSEEARKKASKAARALRYLVDRIGVSVDNIPEALQKHGGIQKLAQLAALNDPRRKSPPIAPGSNTAEQGEADHFDVRHRKERKPVFDRQVQIALPPKLRAKLDDLADSTAIKIIGFVRVPTGEQPTIEFQDITALSGSSAQEENEDDWGD
ncbi:hypothetical protein UNPF46_30820 [Bradyrhizobium sp. UNPF46]|uniref:hypothetical protein n=1 Tax=Bradyrhizobium sp. UNPF46 TaxID=1141168 RepID=UPI0011511F60|nr:hypothetical protein [Bradyrhizobium sp. UNPF46]TQF27455.1 hypothetical protein UNPF46_30820 [Bradyrhizobium sp. UNPF46]